MRQFFAIAVITLAAAAANAAVVPLSNSNFNNNADGNFNLVDGWTEASENQVDSIAQINNAFGKSSGDLVVRLGYKYDDVSLRQLTSTPYGTSGYGKWVLSVDALATTDQAGVTPVSSGTTQAFSMIFTANNVNIKSNGSVLAGNTWQTFTLEITLAEVLSNSAGAQNIEIRFFKGANTANFVMLDNVHLESVPTPAALPAGLALLAMTAMRRRK
ncbi:MAG: hypothetical protein GC162_07240 [Planctomycetes bacterium]|nr:hypothetical protein [Planctomycetota bacterium]